MMVKQIMNKTEESSPQLQPVLLDSIDWTPETETLFFQSFLSKTNAYKPSGINKHFHMLIAYHRFIKSMNRNVDIELLWNKLESLYDLDDIDRSQVEKLDFPNEEMDFKLPSNINAEEILLQRSEDELEKKRNSRSSPFDTKKLSNKKRKI